jgi:hypothetical protein
MNQVKQAVKSWIDDQKRSYPLLEDVPVVMNGEQEDVVMPIIVVIDGSSNVVEQNGVRLHGVMEVGLTVELHTVPEETTQSGTPYADAVTMESGLFEILGNRKSLDFLNASNNLQVFDNLTSSGIISVRDERRITSYDIVITACLNNQQPQST